MNMKEFGPGGRGARPWRPPLGSANGMDSMATNDGSLYLMHVNYLTFCYSESSLMKLNAELVARLKFFRQSYFVRFRDN